MGLARTPEPSPAPSRTSGPSSSTQIHSHPSHPGPEGTGTALGAPSTTQASVSAVDSLVPTASTATPSRRSARVANKDSTESISFGRGDSSDQFSTFEGLVMPPPRAPPKATCAKSRSKSDSTPTVRNRTRNSAARSGSTGQYVSENLFASPLRDPTQLPRPDLSLLDRPQVSFGAVTSMNPFGRSSLSSHHFGSPGSTPLPPILATPTTLTNTVKRRLPVTTKVQTSSTNDNRSTQGPSNKAKTNTTSSVSASGCISSTTAPTTASRSLLPQLTAVASGSQIPSPTVGALASNVQHRLSATLIDSDSDQHDQSSLEESPELPRAAGEDTEQVNEHLPAAINTKKRIDQFLSTSQYRISE